MPPVNKYGFKVGDTFKVVHADDFNIGDVVTLTMDDDSACPEFTNQDGYVRYEFYSRLELIPNEPVENAKIALKKARQEMITAQYALSKAYADREALNKFTEADIKNLMIVSLFSNKPPYAADNLRLVSVYKDVCTFSSSNGYILNTCKRTELVNELNCTYFKTNKTLKDFADA